MADGAAASLTKLEQLHPDEATLAQIRQEIEGASAVAAVAPEIQVVDQFVVEEEEAPAPVVEEAIPSWPAPAPVAPAKAAAPVPAPPKVVAPPVPVAPPQVAAPVASVQIPPAAAKVAVAPPVPKVASSCGRSSCQTCRCCCFGSLGRFCFRS